MEESSDGPYMVGTQTSSRTAIGPARGVTGSGGGLPIGPVVSSSGVVTIGPAGQGPSLEIIIRSVVVITAEIKTADH